MSVKVVDASAVAALLFGEPQAGVVAGRLEGADLVAPTLLGYEVASVCLKKIQLHPDRREELLGALGLLGRMDIREVDVPAADAVLLAGHERLTVYDAAYLWLARELSAELVTLDARLRRAAKR